MDNRNGAIRVCSFLFLLALLVSCTPTGTPVDVNYYKVLLEATGNATSVRIEFNNEYGAPREVDDTSLPWTKEFTSREGRPMFLSATNNNLTGQITVKIEYDGILLEEEIGPLPYTVTVTASGDLP